MSLKELMSADILNKLNEIKGQLDDFPQERKVFSSEDLHEIEKELLSQAEQEASSDDVDMDFLNSFGGPVSESGKEKVVEVEYLGRIGYIDISFESLDSDLTENEYAQVVENLEFMAYQADENRIREAAKQIEKLGEKVIEVIFREGRKFDLSNPRKKNEIVQLLSRLTVRSLKGRRVLKAILLKANSPQHIRMAILVSGMINDREVVNDLLLHARSPEYFVDCFDALLKIRDKRSVKPLLDVILSLDVNRKDLIDQARSLASRFYVFGPDCVKDVFEAYIQCDKFQIRPILTIALQSFQDDAIPMLLEVLESEEDIHKISRTCKTLGGIRHAYATKALMEAYERFPRKRVAIIDGLSHTKDKDVLPFVLKALDESHSVEIKQKCLHALAFIGDRDLIPVVKPYLQMERGKLYLDALFCMVSFGDSDALERYVKLLVDGTEVEQNVIGRFTNMVPVSVLGKMSRKILQLPDNKAIFIVSALQRSHVVPRELRDVLKQKLKEKISDPLRLEIYKLIGKHVNTKNELLPQEVLYEAKEKETNPRIKRELQNIIQNMKQEDGYISVRHTN